MYSRSADVIFDCLCMSDYVNRLVGVSTVIIIITNLRLIATWCLSDASLIIWFHFILSCAEYIS